jgi:class 3 adenylate cyclase
VVFADISGFTALAERLDPEAVRNLMNSCFEHLVPVIEKYEGTVDKFVGDAVMALFGAPLAHENDAERALRASLEMVEALAKFNAEHRLDLGLHFGINTGEVIAGEIGSQGRRDYSVMGDAVNLAARLEDVSQRGEILVGPDTHRMTAALFEFETLPTITLKGKSEPIVVHRLSGLRSTPATTRGIRGLRSPLVGRDVELARLGVVLRSLRDGTGGVVAVTGEAGLGKSRLIAELRQSEGRGITWAEGRALSHTTRMSYWTARDILISLLELTPDTPPHDIKLILRGGVRQILPEKADEVYAYLATFMGLPEDEVIAGHTSYLAGGVLKKRIREAFRDYVAARASERPLAVVWEDLHWADSSSLDLLREVLPLGGRMPCLLILAFRPEGSINQILDVSIPPSTPKYEVVKLEPLHRLECESLVQNLLKIENLHDTTLKLILDRAEGNPFYLEELLRALIDANAVVVRDGHAFATRPIEQMDIPNTLQGVLMARIDRLPLESKQALQTASVIGRVFQLKVLERLYSTPTAGDGLHAHLDVLERREFVHPRNGPEIAQGLAAQEYIFKHVVTQSVAYNCLLIARRKQIHRAAGEAMEALFPDRIGELAVTLAHHFEMAGAVDRALHYLALAAERAKNIYSNTEAIALYEKAIDQVNKLLVRIAGRPASGTRWPLNFT